MFLFLPGLLLPLSVAAAGNNNTHTATAAAQPRSLALGYCASVASPSPTWCNPHNGVLSSVTKTNQPANQHQDCNTIGGLHNNAIVQPLLTPLPISSSLLILSYSSTCCYLSLLIIAVAVACHASSSSRFLLLLLILCLPQSALVSCLYFLFVFLFLFHHHHHHYWTDAYLFLSPSLFYFFTAIRCNIVSTSSSSSSLEHATPPVKEIAADRTEDSFHLTFVQQFTNLKVLQHHGGRRLHVE